MTRTAINLALCTVVSFVVFGLAGCQPAAPDTNRNAATTATAKEAFNPAAIEAEVLRLDREWANVIKTRDVDAMKRIEADDIVLIYPDGTTGTKADDIRDIESNNLTAESFDVTDSKVTVLSADAAVITGRSVLKKAKYKRPDGKQIDISGEYRFTDVFGRRNGNWQVVVSQATKIEAPTATPTPAKPSPSAVRSPSPAASKSP
ncbi:MAG TPA: nuclear transport factor 2 family protein [Pyrinomonadaceae bacterium]|jgi:ketosteroid isomerase-like protein